jgi:heme exporter protein A
MNYIQTALDAPALRLRKIARRFGTRWALRGVSLDVAPSEAVAILGHNGSGKSTLLRLCCTSLRPTSGVGWVYGWDLVKEAEQVRRLVAFFAHVPGLYEDLTAWENLRFAARMLDRPEADIAPLLERVGLWRERGERVRSFSAGMQRRLALARLLLSRPRLLLLDEPYNNFDPQGIELVNGIVREVCEGGGAALIVVHDRRQGEAVAGRFVELGQGVVVSDMAVGARPEARVAWQVGLR